MDKKKLKKTTIIMTKLSQHLNIIINNLKTQENETNKKTIKRNSRN
jgi:hypothetical protein